MQIKQRGDHITLSQVVDRVGENYSLSVRHVSVPPQWLVEKLHPAGISITNAHGNSQITAVSVLYHQTTYQMVGHPKHVAKALEAGIDFICAQAGEGGEHTGDVPASILILAVVDAFKGKKSPLTGGPILVIGAGGVYDGRGLAVNLSWGAQATVWVGTRFVASEEAGVPPAHKKAIVNAGHEDFDPETFTFFASGRITARLRPRPSSTKTVSSPSKMTSRNTPKSLLVPDLAHFHVAAQIHEVLLSKKIIEDMVNDAAAIMERNTSLIRSAID